MKKRGLLFSVLALGGVVTAVAVAKTKKKAKEYEEVMFVEIDDNDDSEQEFGYVVDELKEIYPYLQTSFINAIYQDNEQFDNQYTGKIKVNHAIVFEDENDCNIFIDVSNENGYDVSKEGLKVYLDSYFENEKGRIMSDILNVANQAVCLNGSYTGYKIEVEKV